MTCWRYKVVSVPGDPGGLLSALDRHGGQGWELVQVLSTGDAIFKQPRWVESH